MEGKTVWDNKRKKHVPVKPKWGYLARSAREFYSGLKNAKHNDPNLDRAIKSASRAFQDLEKLRDPESCPPKKKRASGGGRKTKSPEVRTALFSWFVDVRECLKVRLPKKMFRLKAAQIYEDWLLQNPTPEAEKLKFSNQWTKEWENEYGISLRKPNKRFSVKQADRVERINDCRKNVWKVRKFFY